MSTNWTGEEKLVFNSKKNLKIEKKIISLEKSVEKNGKLEKIGKFSGDVYTEECQKNLIEILTKFNEKKKCVPKLVDDSEKKYEKNKSKKDYKEERLNMMFKESNTRKYGSKEKIDF